LFSKRVFSPEQSNAYLQDLLFFLFGKLALLKILILLNGGVDLVGGGHDIVDVNLPDQVLDGLGSALAGDPLDDVGIVEHEVEQQDDSKSEGKSGDQSNDVLRSQGKEAGSTEINILDMSLVI